MLPIRATSGGAVAFLLVVVAMFAMGATTGAEAATNESVSLSNTSAELDTIPENLEQNISENMTGAKQTVTLSVIMPPIETAVSAANTGLNLGYHHPTLGYFLGDAAPVAVLAGFGIVYYRELKKVWHIYKTP